MKEELFGEHGLEIWIAGIFWVILSLLLYKLFELIKSNKVTMATFKFRYWINANLFVCMFGIIASLLILRLGDYAFHIANKFGYEFGETKDFVAWMIPITWFVQWKLEKLKKPVINKTVKENMCIHNEKHIIK